VYILPPFALTGCRSLETRSESCEQGRLSKHSGDREMEAYALGGSAAINWQAEDDGGSWSWKML
jgi:hypothetical protein